MAQKTTDLHTFLTIDDDPTMTIDVEGGFDWESFEDDDDMDSLTRRLVAPDASLPLAAVVAGPQARPSTKSAGCDMPPTVEIPAVLLDDEGSQARTPADWERVSVEMDAADPLDLLLQSVDSMLTDDVEPAAPKSPDIHTMRRSTRPVAPKPQPYKEELWDL